MPGPIEELKNELNTPEPEPEKPESPEAPEETEEKFVEVDGEKFKEDPANPGQALLDAEENPIPFETKKKEEPKFVMPEKFKDKSSEEIAKSYTELEKMVSKKVEEGMDAKLEELIKQGKITKVEAKEIKKEVKKDKPEKEDKTDYSKMTPKQFAEHLDKRVEERIKKIMQNTEELIGKILTTRDKVKSEVSKEVKEARKDHPLLKVNKEYTELVVAIVEAASSRGKKMTLKEACAKVDSIMGDQKDKKDLDKEAKEKLKKAKAIVEKPGKPTPSGGPETEEEKIKRKLLEGKGTGPLGGL